MMKRTLSLLLLCCSSLAFAQGVFVTPQTALKSVNGFTYPIANATITVCAAGVSGIPCSPALVGALFKDSGLTQPLSNPFLSDAQGNYTFAIASGNYTVTVTAAGYAGNSYQITAGGAGGTLPVGTPAQIPVVNLPGTFYAPQTMTKNGALDTSGNFTLNSIGPTTVGSSPEVIVGVQCASIAACVTYLQSTLGLNGGTIYSRIPEEIPVGVFALTNFHGHLKLGNGTTNTSQCGQGPTFNCWTTDGPLLMTDQTRILGVNPSNFLFSTSRGSVITFSSTFPSALGAPPAPTLTCDASAGSIPTGTQVFVQFDESNNFLGNTNNANAQRTPGHSAVSPEASITVNHANCTNDPGGTGPYEVSIAAPAQLTSSNTVFNAVDVGVYSATQSGQEAQNIVTTDLTCVTAGVADKRGCNGQNGGSWAPGTVKITQVPILGGSGTVPSGRMHPCYRANNNDTSGFVADCSNPLIAMQNGTPGTDNNIFNVRLEHVLLQGSPTGNTNPLSNEPALAFLNASAQENSGAYDVLASGAFGANNNLGMFYTGFRGGNSFLKEIHVPSNAGPLTGSWCMVDAIFDGRATGNGGARIFEDGSLNGQNGTGCPRMLVVGRQSNVNATGLHVESRGDGIFVDDLGSVSAWDASSTVPLTFASMHFSTTADISCGYVGKQGDTHAAFKDDKSGITITPGQGLGAAYCTNQYFGMVHSNFVFGDQAGCTNGELTLSAGWGSTTSKTGVQGHGQSCRWILTTGGVGFAANPTITDTLPVALPDSSVVCDMHMVGGTGTFTLINQTTQSATAPVWTFNGTPVIGNTYIVTRTCGP